MSSDVCRLGDIANIQGGYAFKSADFNGEGVVVVKIANIQPPLVSLAGADRVALEKVVGLERFRLQDGDILMAMTGATVGKVGRFKEIEPAYLNQRVARITARKGKLFDDFIYAVVSQPGFDSQIEGASAGSAQANISAAGIGSVQIPQISDGEQIAIGALAKVLDDRITLLRETNATLEAIAQALFKSWFVDFDPVRAKQQGRAPEGMDEATAALFPDAFEESELGPVPRGWRVGAFSDVCTITSGKRPPDRSDTATDVCSIPLYGGAGVMGFTSASLFDVPKVVTGRVGTLGKVHIAYPPFWASDNVLVITPNDQSLFTVVLHWLRSVDVLALNRGSTQPLLTQRDLGARRGVIPSSNVVAIFEGIAKPLYRRIRNQERQAQTLASLRDTLLPRLISGQLRLDDLPPEARP